MLAEIAVVVRELRSGRRQRPPAGRLHRACHGGRAVQSAEYGRETSLLSRIEALQRPGPFAFLTGAGWSNVSTAKIL
ncbi:hypothetical protein ES703_118306 [subsurface metagenome]